MQLRAIAVHDISCVGRCSLTVALPVLSAAGIDTAVIPTALLSTHTGEFTGYTHLDLSDQLLPIARHLSTLGRHFDAFYSGYLASGAQVREVLRVIDLICDEKTQLFIDPAFADNGRLYSLMDESMPDEMLHLCRRADTIVPNLTEACFLLGLPYPGGNVTERFVNGLCRDLRGFGIHHVVITDVSFQPDQTGVAVLGEGMEAPIYLFRGRYPGVFHGTGDVFASFLLCALMHGQKLTDAVTLALDLTHESIRLTLLDEEPLRYGVQFEKTLPTLWERLHLSDSMR